MQILQSLKLKMYLEYKVYSISSIVQGCFFYNILLYAHYYIRCLLVKVFFTPNILGKKVNILEHPVPPVAEHQTIQFWTTNNQTAGELKCYCLFRHGGQMPERFLCVSQENVCKFRKKTRLSNALKFNERLDR